MRYKLSVGERVLLAGSVGVLTVLATVAGATASSSTWKLSDGSVKAPPGIATFNFAVPDKAHLLLSDAPELTGDLSSKTAIGATFTIQGVTGAFTYGGEGTSLNNCTGPEADANVRLYFESIPPGSKFAETNYWWANPANGAISARAFLAAPTALSNDFNGANWSDFYGHFGNDPAYMDGFNAALKNVTAVGLSFGGGCFFENGVGTTDGSGTVTLNTFTVS